MKILKILLLVLTISLSIIPLVQAANSPSLSGIQIFPKDHIWNTRADNLPVDGKSDIYIKNMIKDTTGYTGLDHYIRTAIPYNVVNSTQRHQYLTHFDYLYYSDNVAYPIPMNPLYELGCADYHMEMIDVDEMTLYELGAVSQASDGSWSASTGAVWDLEGYSFRKNGETPMWATNEAGLPKFPGLVRYDEVSAGHIDHALAISIPAMQNIWVWPARSAQINDPSDPAHPPAGQRFRLKASYDISGYPPQAKVILQALKTYGAMAQTNTGVGNPVSVIGSPDTRWNFDDLKTLRSVNLSNFEAVDVSSVMIDENSAQARQIASVTPTPTPTPTPTLTPTPTTNIQMKIGVTNGVDWYFDANGNGMWDGAAIDKNYNFGRPGNVSVVGDWNGDNKTEIGVTNGVDWYLDANGNGMWDGSSVDKMGYFGISGYTPIVGDWNGDNKSDIGVTNGVNWYLDANGNGMWDGPSIDQQGFFGIAGFTPVVGDWTGDGKTKIGVYKDGIWYLDLNGNGRWNGPTVDKQGFFGITGFTPVLGDWSGDGKGTKIGVYKDGIWYLDYNGNGTWDIGTDKEYLFGEPWWAPVIGK